MTGSNAQFMTVRPPKELKFDPEFVYKIPVNEEAPDFKEYATRQVFSIAELYQMDKWQLLDLLSQSIDQIKEDIELKKALLAHAS